LRLLNYIRHLILKILLFQNKKPFSKRPKGWKLTSSPCWTDSELLGLKLINLSGINFYFAIN